MKVAMWLLCAPVLASGQSDLETAIRGGELILTGLTAFRMAKSDPYGTLLQQVCVKNKFEGKITFQVTGKDQEGEDIVRELVIAPDGKECLFELPKGIYRYQVTLADETVAKKGEMKIEKEQTIVLKAD